MAMRGFECRIELLSTQGKRAAIQWTRQQHRTVLETGLCPVTPQQADEWSQRRAAHSIVHHVPPLVNRRSCPSDVLFRTRLEYLRSSFLTEVLVASSLRLAGMTNTRRHASPQSNLGHHDKSAWS